MTKILIVESSEILKEYLSEKLDKLGFEVYAAKDGFDGLIKLKNEIPDLVIMDIVLKRLSGYDFLREKNQYKIISDVPVILLTNRLDRELIEKLASYKINKIIAKPIKIDALFSAVSEIIKSPVEIDSSYSVVDIHLNEDLLFVEISGGLNREKLEILKYKIKQILSSNEIKYPKVLIILTDIEFSEDIGILLSVLLNSVIDSTNTPLPYIKILTTLNFIKEFLNIHDSYKSIEVTDDFNETLNSLGKGDVFAFGDELDKLKIELISKIDKSDFEEVFDMNLSLEVTQENNNVFHEPSEKFKIAVVDDDLHILEYLATVLSETGWEILIYDSGRSFLNDVKKNMPDLIFLDLMMPEINGFEIMQRLRNAHLNMPIVVISALIDKEYIFRAKKFGVTSYLTKPLKADIILSKAYEMLRIKKS